MRRRKTKTTIKEDETNLRGYPATITVTEITRRPYNKPVWNGYGVAFRVPFDKQDDFTYRVTFEKSRLHRGPLQSFCDWLFNRSPPTSLTDVIIEVAHDAEEALENEYDGGEVSLEEQVDSALVAIN